MMFRWIGRTAGTAALTVGLTACGTPGSTGPAQSSAVAGQPGKTPSTGSSYDPAAECARSIGYWARTLVTPGSDWGLDYQEMGLSSGEYSILQNLLPTARTLARQEDPSVIESTVQREAAGPCLDHVAALPSSPGPSGWPQ